MKNIQWPMKCNFLVALKFQGQEKRFSWWPKKFMAMKNFFHGGEKISWPRKTFFMGCEKDSYIIHWNFMAINQGHEIDNCYIHDHEKWFTGFPWTFYEIFIELMLVVIRKFSISFQGPKFFNSLSFEIRNATSTASFCCKLKAFLLS